MSLIVGIMVLGLALVMLEIFIPGGVVGVLGGICLLAGVAFAFDAYGMEGAIIAFCVGLVGLVACLWFEFKILPKTAAGKRLFLNDVVGGTSQKDVGEESMLGKTASTVTALAPSGYVVFEGKRLEAVSRSGFLEKGERVRIESIDQFKITVSKI